MADSGIDDYEDYEAANRRLLSEWSRSNATRDAERTRGANERDRFRRADGPTFAPPPSGGSARGNATAEWSVGQLAEQESEYLRLVEDVRKHNEARRPAGRSALPPNATVAERHAAAALYDGAA